MFKLFKRNQPKKIILKAPFTGEVIELANVPDEVFAQKMVGDGIAIKPVSEYLLAPVEGKIIQLFPTNHALGIKTKEGLELLIHLGIDSVKLKGKGFTPLVEEGQKVAPGDKLIKIDWPSVSKEIPSIITPIVITNMEIVEVIDILAEGEVQSGENLLAVIVKG